MTGGRIASDEQKERRHRSFFIPLLLKIAKMAVADFI